MLSDVQLDRKELQLDHLAKMFYHEEWQKNSGL